MMTNDGSSSPARQRLGSRNTLVFGRLSRLLALICVACAVALQAEGWAGDVALNFEGLRVARSVLVGGSLASQQDLTTSLALKGSPSWAGCLQLELYLAREQWDQAIAWSDSGRCSQAPDLVSARPLARYMTGGIRALRLGDGRAALDFFHMAVLEKGVSPGADMIAWLKQAGAMVYPETAGWPEWPSGKPAEAGRTASSTIKLGRAGTGGEWITSPQAVSGSWSLERLDFVSSDLDVGLPLRARLAWRAGPPVPDAQASGLTSQADGTLLQASLLQNMIPNGNFEWNLGTNVFPALFSGDFFNLGQLRSVAIDQRSGAPTHVLRFDADPGGHSAGAYTTLPLQVRSGCSYLLGAWLKSEGAQPGIAIGWLGVSGDPNSSSTIVYGVQAPDWAYYAGLAIPPPGATGLRVILTNWGSEGRMEVDDILLAAIGAPNGKCTPAG